MAEENADAVQWFRERLDQLAAVLEADVAEQAMFTVLREARERWLRQREVMAALVQKGYGIRKGSPFSLMQVRRLMRRAQIA